MYMYIYMYISMYVYMYIYMYAYICTYQCMYIYTLNSGDRFRVDWLAGLVRGVPREHKMLEGHLPRVIYREVHKYTKRNYAPWGLNPHRHWRISGRRCTPLPSNPGSVSGRFLGNLYTLVHQKDWACISICICLMLRECMSCEFAFIIDTPWPLIPNFKD